MIKAVRAFMAIKLTLSLGGVVPLAARGDRL